MSEPSSSELEAKYRETGAVEDHAAWLRARVEAGELEPLHVKLAGFYGLHEAAQLAEPVSGPWSLPSVDEEPQVAVRFGLALSRVLREGWDAQRADDAPSPAATIEAAERWCCDPSEETAAAVAATLDAEQPAWWDGLAGLIADPKGFDDFFQQAAKQAAFLGHDDVRAAFTAAVQADLVPWLLGEGDPVRDRASE